MSNLSTESLEVFINEQLKEELKYLEKWLTRFNNEITAHVQLKNIIESLKESQANSYKTQVDIGANVFLKAKVDSSRKMLINVGLEHFLECDYDDALKFTEFKIKHLTKEVEVVREQSVKKRGEIKLALMVIGEQEGLHEDTHPEDTQPEATPPEDTHHGDDEGQVPTN